MITLKEIRKSSGYSQEQLAALLGIKQQQYARYENGINKISLEMFLKILTACNYKLKLKKEK